MPVQGSCVFRFPSAKTTMQRMKCHNIRIRTVVALFFLFYSNPSATKVKTIFEELGGKYERQGDYLIPCLTVPVEEEQLIGTWGQRQRVKSLSFFLES